MHILVVDDNPDIIRLVDQVLTLEGHRVTIARDGLEALQQVSSSQPDAVVLDVNMPGMEGWEVCQRIKQQSNTPVMMLTVHANQSDVQHGLDVGADAYLAKPFDISQFLERLNAMLLKQYGAWRTAR